MALEHLGLVLVDEASMVDSTLLEIALRCAHPFRTRLVFVGDPAQLPPVGEPQSPVFAMGRRHAGPAHQVVRHQGPVLRLATGLRKGGCPAAGRPQLPADAHGRGQVALLDAPSGWPRPRRPCAAAPKPITPTYARILCYTNRSLEQLVPIARRAIHGEMADQLPVLPGRC